VRSIFVPNLGKDFTDKTGVVDLFSDCSLVNL
jgi:hypothetical protein